MSMVEEIRVWSCIVRGHVLRDGKFIQPPEGWVFVAAGDAGVTRRIKAAGDYWVLVQRRKNRIEALGVFAPQVHVEVAKQEIEAERTTPTYLKKCAARQQHRHVQQEQYKEAFYTAVLLFLNFATKYHALACVFARTVTDFSVPIGSGTVARTQRLSLEQRAEAAVMAWMRHQTTGYEALPIARVKGERRLVRRALAEQSRALLRCYRSGAPVDFAQCPLACALRNTPRSETR